MDFMSKSSCEWTLSQNLVGNGFLRKNVVVNVPLKSKCSCEWTLKSSCEWTLRQNLVGNGMEV
jgi:hypothetical protein